MIGLYVANSPLQALGMLDCLHALMALFVEARSLAALASSCCAVWRLALYWLIAAVRASPGCRFGSTLVHWSKVREKASSAEWLLVVQAENFWRAVLHFDDRLALPPVDHALVRTPTASA